MAEKENNEIGFAGIGKRIENLNANIDAESTTDWKQETEIPRQTNTDSANKQGPPKIYKQKIGLPFKLSFAKVFWGIVAIVIIASMFSQNNYKKKTNDTPTNPTPQRSAPPPAADDVITNGQYRCSRYNHNRAQELEPTIFEKQDIERQQNILNNERQDVEVLKNQIETMHVDRYSQESIDSYNMLVNKYNIRLEEFNINVNALQKKIDNYNSKVNIYNNYMMANCRKAY